MTAHQHSHEPAMPPAQADASVRPAAPSDAPAVGVVQALVWGQEYGALVPADVAARFEPREFAKAWRSSLQSPPTARHRLLVACAGAQVVGFGAVGPSTDPDAQPGVDAELLVLAVHPQARRVGHGSRLLNAVADTTREDGFRRLRTWLHTPDSERFLAAAGFAPDGAHRERVVGPSPDDTIGERRFSAVL